VLSVPPNQASVIELADHGLIDTEFFVGASKDCPASVRGVTDTLTICLSLQFAENSRTHVGTPRAALGDSLDGRGRNSHRPSSSRTRVDETEDRGPGTGLAPTSKSPTAAPTTLKKELDYV
jgi:hypothetical protein